MNEAGDQAAQAGPVDGERQGVVFVHGVGNQHKSDTLLDFGGPLLQWLARWYAARGEPAPLVRSVDLSFAPVDVGDGDSLPRGTLYLQNGRSCDSWVCAEAWWASSNRHPGFAPMLSWSVRYLGDIIANLYRATLQRIRRLLRREPDTAPPSIWARIVDLVNSAGLLALYPLAALAGYAVLLPLMLLSLVPIPTIQNWVVANLISPFLEVNAGEFRTYLDDDLQAANIHRRVADAVTWLVQNGGCAEVTIVAHSEGAVVSFGMLADPDPAFSVAQQHVRKLITLGAGLNKSWLLAPRLERLRRPIGRHIHWLDMWASYDLVPAGWLDPPRRYDGIWVRIFDPSDEVVRVQHLKPRDNPSPYAPATESSRAMYWPVSEQVTNDMSVLADHGGYLSNDEQVLIRLAAEIDALYYQNSRFWRGDAAIGPCEKRTPALRTAVQRRRERVSALALVRMALVLAALAVSGVFWSQLIARGGGIAGLFATYPRVPPGPGITHVLVVVVNWLRTAPVLGLTGLIDGLLAIPFAVLGALLIGLPFIVLYALIRTYLWDPWNRSAENQSDAAVATAGRGPAAERAGVP